MLFHESHHSLSLTLMSLFHEYCPAATSHKLNYNLLEETNKQVNFPARRMQEANYVPRQTNGIIIPKFTPDMTGY